MVALWVAFACVTAVTCCYSERRRVLVGEWKGRPLRKALHSLPLSFSFQHARNCFCEEPSTSARKAAVSMDRKPIKVRASVEVGGERAFFRWNEVASGLTGLETEMVR